MQFKLLALALGSVLLMGTAHAEESECPGKPGTAGKVAKVAIKVGKAVRVALGANPVTAAATELLDGPAAGQTPCEEEKAIKDAIARQQAEAEAKAQREAHARAVAEANARAAAEKAAAEKAAADRAAQERAAQERARREAEDRAVKALERMNRDFRDGRGERGTRSDGPSKEAMERASRTC